jgi:hypothetical protein
VDCNSAIVGSIPTSASKARVAKLVDARDLKSLGGNTVPVQVRPRAPFYESSGYCSAYTYVNRLVILSPFGALFAHLILLYWPNIYHQIRITMRGTTTFGKLPKNNLSRYRLFEDPKSYYLSIFF